MKFSSHHTVQVATILTTLALAFPVLPNASAEDESGGERPSSEIATPTPKPKPTAKPTATPPKVVPKASPTPAMRPAVPVAPVAIAASATPYKAEGSKKFPKTVSKLLIDDLQAGRGRPAKAGSKLVVHFTSWLYDPTQPLGRGPQFESTQGKPPYHFTLQSAEAPHIKGWEVGILEMKAGGRRRLIIPPDYAYGPNGAGQVIPPNATLLYEVELIDIE